MCALFEGHNDVIITYTTSVYRLRIKTNNNETIRKVKEDKQEAKKKGYSMETLYYHPTIKNDWYKRNG